MPPRTTARWKACVWGGLCDPVQLSLAGDAASTLCALQPPPGRKTVRNSLEQGSAESGVIAALKEGGEVRTPMRPRRLVRDLAFLERQASCRRSTQTGTMR